MSNTTYVYLVKSGDDIRAPIKIGVAKDVDQRIYDMQTGNPSELYLITKIPFNSSRLAYHIENMLHKKFRKKRIRGEWFKWNIKMKVISDLCHCDSDDSYRITEMLDMETLEDAKHHLD